MAGVQGWKRSRDNTQTHTRLKRYQTMSTELILAEFPIVPISLSPALTTKLGELQVKAKTITAISDVESQAKGASVCRDMQTELKMMEKSRKKVTEPALAYQKTCKKVVDDAS